MRFSQKTEYAIRAMLELARREGAGPVCAREIAETQEIPPRFLEQVLQELKRGGLLSSQRGAAGGCWLARPATDIPLSEVVDIVEGPVVTQAHLNPFDDRSRRSRHSAIQEVWLDLQITIRERLSRVSVADLAKRQDELDRSSYLAFQI